MSEPVGLLLFFAMLWIAGSISDLAWTRRCPPYNQDERDKIGHLRGINLTLCRCGSQDTRKTKDNTGGVE